MNFSKWFTKGPVLGDDFASRFRSSQLMIFSFNKSSVCLHLGNVMIRGSTGRRAIFWRRYILRSHFLDITKLLAWWKTWTFLSMSILQWFLNWAIHHNLRKHIHWRCQFEYLNYKHTYPRVPGIVGNPSPIRYSLEHQAVCVAGFSIEMEITWSTCGGCGITSSWDDVFV